MLLPICIELLSWLSGSVLHCFSKPLVRWACKQARLYLPKIAFPYWSNVCFGCDWHILTSELALLSVSQKDENPALFSVSSIKCRLAHRPHSISSFGSLGIGKRCFKNENNSIFSIRLLTDYWFHEKSARCPSSYPKAFRLLPKSGSSKVCFE